MALDLSAFKSAPKKSTNNLNLSAFGGTVATKKPDVSNATPLFLPSIFDTKTSASTPSVLDEGAFSPIGATLGFAKEVGRAIANNIASAGITVAHAINPKTTPLKSSDIPTFFGQALFDTVFGKDVTIKSIEDRIAEAEPKVDIWKKDLQNIANTPGLSAREKFVVDVLGNLDTPTLSFVGIMGSVGLDLSPVGGLQKNVYKKLIEETTEEGGYRFLKSLGVDESLARNFAADIPGISNNATAKKFFEAVANMQATTRETAQATLPKTSAEAATRYTAEVIAPAKSAGRAIVLGSDDVKDFFAKDYDNARHPIYSQATKDLFYQEVPASTNPIVRFTSGGPGAGKTDFIMPGIKEGFDGVIYDSTLSDFKTAVDRINVVESAGKKVEINMIIPDPETSRFFSLKRAEEIGRHVDTDYFVKTTVGSPAVARQLLEEGIIQPGDIKILDLRGATTKEAAMLLAMRADKYVSDPVEFLKTLGYNDNYVRDAATRAEKRFTQLDTGGRSQPIQVSEGRGTVDGSPPNGRGVSELRNGESRSAAQLPTNDQLAELKRRAQNSTTKEEVDDLVLQLSFYEDAIEQMPGKELSKYVSRATGELPEITGKATKRSISGSGKEVAAGDFTRRGDDIIRQAFGRDADWYEAQKAVEDYRDLRGKVKDLKANILDKRTDLSAKKKLGSIEGPARKAGVKEGEFLGRQTGFREGMEVAGKTIQKQQTQLQRSEALAVKKDGIINLLKNTTQSTQRIKDLIFDYARSALSPTTRGKALKMVSDAKTARDLTKAVARINRWSEDELKNSLRGEVLKAQKRIVDSPSIALDYKQKIKELMSDVNLKRTRESTLDKLRATQKFLDDEAAKGKVVDMPTRVLRALSLLERTPFEEITINQLKGLQAEMELLEDLGRTKYRTMENVWEIQKGRILKEVAAQGAPPVEKIELLKPAIGERLTVTQKFKNFIWSTINQAARIDKAISPMDVIFDLLDGGKGTYAGANFRFFKGQVDAGYGRYLSRSEALREPVHALAAKHKLISTNFERMGVVAAREQDGGVEKLLGSGFTQEAIDAVKLTPQEQEVLDLMRATMDSQFPEIQTAMRTVYNKPVEKVKNYFSFMTDFKAMDESEVFARFGSQGPEQFGAPRKNVEAGFTKSRVGGKQKIKIDAADIFDKHIDNTSYLLELGETTKMLGEVANSPKYGELVGDVGQLMVREWIDVIARKGGAAGAQEIAILDTLRRNVGAGILGLKLSTVAIQPTALIDGAAFIGAKYAMKGVTNFATSAEWRRFVYNMPEIKDRLGGEFALRELSDDNWLQNIQKKGFIPMQALDQMTAGAIAGGAYERKMIELGRVVDTTKAYDAEALAYAQLAVRRTQSSGSFKDVSLAISRGTLTKNRSLDRAILQFQNFLLTRWSRVRHDAIRAGINTRDPRKGIVILSYLIMAGLAASGIRYGVNKVQDFITGRERDDDAATQLQKSFLYEMTGNVPFVGTGVSMAMYDGEMFPIIDAPKGVVSGLNRVLTSQSESAKLRGLTEFTGSLGAILGVPGSAQAEQLTNSALQDKKGGGISIPSIKIPSVNVPSIKIPSIKI